jgi:muramoyltetrapeptide carboxypeptidase
MVSKAGQMNSSVKTIAIVAPGSPVEPSRFARAKAALEQTGFAVKTFGDPAKLYGSNLGGFSSDIPEARVAAIKAAFSDESVSAVLMAKGGYGSLELLPHLPIKEIAASRKPLIGFSDGTALLVAIANEGGIAIHGPTLESGWGKDSIDEDTLRSTTELIQVINSPSATVSLITQPLRGELALVDAPVIGGNLTVLASLCGSPWQVNAKGKFLFLEEVGERPYRIHRAITQLKLSGSLHGCLGILLGHFTKCTHDHGPTAMDAILDALADVAVPIATGVQSGHEALNLPVVFGN